MCRSRYIFNTNQGCMNLHEFILSHLHTCQTRLLDTLKFPLWKAILRSPSCAESRIFSWKQACKGTTFNSTFDSDIQIFEMSPFQWSVSAHTKTKRQNDSFSTPLCWINKNKKQLIEEFVLLFESCLFIFLFGHLCQLTNDIPHL